jgi:Mobilization protein NikA
MSRPRQSEPRSKQLNLSLTERELAGIEARAAALGMRPVHFSRALLLSPSRVLQASSTEPSDAVAPAGNVDRLIHLQLVRLGNNLNQMMRHLHRLGSPVPDDLWPLLTDIRALISRLSQ